MSAAASGPAAPPIPVLDLRRFDEGEDAKRELARELGAALGDWGFVGIRGHGISDALRDRTYAETRRLFALPDAVKRRHLLEGAGGQRGYTAFGMESAKDSDVADLKEFWHVGPEPPARDDMMPNEFPPEVPGFKEVILELYGTLSGVGAKVLRLIALHLELPEDYFEDKVDHADTIMRPLHYPPVDAGAIPAGAVRAAAHEDINVITLLVGSHEPGLEVLSKQGEWVGVTTLEDTIVCNVGDMLQRLTNHDLVSTTHRVVNPPEPWASQSRFSLPYFLHFNPEFEIATLDSCISDAHPNRYPEPITAQAYLDERLRELGLK